MLTISHSPQRTSFQARKIPPKTLTIINKNGRDILKDEFVGFHVIRPSLLEVLKNLFDDLFSLLQK